MYNTSSDYKERIYEGQQCLLNIYIDGEQIDDDDIWGFKVSHNLFTSDSVSLGSTTSKAMELQINKESLPETYSSFYVETGLNIDGVDEIVPIGYFTLEEIQQDDEVVTITAVDYMMKFEKIISSEVQGTALQLLQAICEACEVELATTDFIGCNRNLKLTDTTLTARQIVGYIAELAGGFAFIGRDGKLYIKHIGESTSEIDIELFQDYSWGEKFVCNEVDFISDEYDFEVSDTDYSSAWLDCVLDSPLYANDLEGQPININSDNLFVTQEEQVFDVYNELKGIEINGFTGITMVDPAIDIGDIIYIDNKPIVFQGDMEYLGYFKGNIASTIQTEEKNRTTVPSVSLANRLQKVSEEVSNKVDADKIIETINNSEEEEQIEHNNINLNGYSSDNGNFTIDDEGNPSVSDKNGNEIAGKKGVYSNLQFVSHTCSGYSSSTGGFADVGFFYTYATQENKKSSIEIMATIPENFTIEKAIITLIHQPKHMYINSSDTVASWYWGYSRNIGIYKSEIDDYYYEPSEEYAEDLPTMEIVSGAFNGSSLWQPSTPSDTTYKNEKIVTSDIKNILEVGQTNRIVIASNDEPPTTVTSEYTNNVNCKTRTGRVFAVLDIFGYANVQE